MDSGEEGTVRADAHERRFPMHIALDGDPGWSPATGIFGPLVEDVIGVTPWAPVGTEAAPVLEWLGITFPQRPLLGITRRALTDPDGSPLRGLSALASRVALVSSHGLSERTLTGVMRHEAGHALGLEHCERWDCALGARPHPLSAESRPPEFCPRCRTLWESLCVRA